MNQENKVKSTNSDWNNIFRYQDGLLYWKQPGRGRPIGRMAGCFDNVRGYLRVCFGGKSYQGHRIIWEMNNGLIPQGMEIDHINRNTGDNRIENLRLVTRAQNTQNMKTPATNTSGYRGAYWDKSKKKWHSRISVNGEVILLGVFDCKEEAAAAYKTAENRHHISKHQLITSN